MSASPPPAIRSPEDLLQLERALDCVHCGLCLPACPTYELSGRESMGPRGRVYLMRGLAEGAIGPAAPVLRDLDACIVCRACEPVCPSGVRFGEMMEFTRSRVLEPARAPSWTRRLLRFALERVVPRPRALGAAVALLAMLDRTGARRLLRRYGVLRYLSPALDARDALLPPIPRRAARKPLPTFTAATSKRRGCVALLEGCVAPHLLGDVNRATLRVLVDQGFDVVVPKRRTCCGALAAHFGAEEAAHRCACETIDAFTAAGDGRAVDAVLANSAGCGAMMKEYGRFAAGAPAFGASVRDVAEFLVERGVRSPARRVEARVAYADACHLAHAQRITSAPRALLQSIPGLDLAPLPRADRCCGAGGLYNVLEPALSLALLEKRLDDLEACGASILATANPGCLLQWRAGVRRRGLAVDVVHPIELLDRAR